MPPRFLVSFPFPKPSSETSTLASRGANRNNPPISGLPALMEAGNSTVAEAAAEAVATSYLTGILLHCMDASASSAVKFPAAFIESFANGRVNTASREGEVPSVPQSTRSLHKAKASHPSNEPMSELSDTYSTLLRPPARPETASSVA